jgi:superfamily II DNA or RNA helicase
VEYLDTNKVPYANSITNNFNNKNNIYFRYSVKDQRQPLKQLFKTDPVTKTSKPVQIGEEGDLFANHGTILRDYQVKAVNAVLDKHRGVVKCATGGGKSLILAAILKVLGTGYLTSFFFFIKNLS